jgi:hypothetical protein
MIVYDFFAGTGSATKAFEDRGHKVIKVELDESFEADERDILKLTADELIRKYGRPDFIWASPPCTTFSVASCRIYWQKGVNGATPKHPKVYEALKLVEHTINLVKQLNPTKGWLMENPRGMLRKQDVVKPLNRKTVTYCQYGDYRMKPTDLWGDLPNWTPRLICKPGSSCHEQAQRGSVRGTQKLRSPKLRSMIPYELGNEIVDVLEGKYASEQDFYEHT